MCSLVRLGGINHFKSHAVQDALLSNHVKAYDIGSANDAKPAKQIKAHHIPIESIMIPIVETFRNCLNIIPDEDQLSSRPLGEPAGPVLKLNGKGRQEFC